MNAAQSLVEQPAKSSISWFALTAVNFSEAVDVLQRRFGNKTAVGQEILGWGRTLVCMKWRERT